MTTDNRSTRTRRIGMLAVIAIAACDGTDDGLDTENSGSVPTIESTDPSDGGVGHVLNGAVRVVFSEEMDPATLDLSTFSIEGELGDVLDGTVMYAGTTATFWPAVHLEAASTYTAMVSTDAHSDLGVPMEDPYVWTFTTGTTLGPGRVVELGAAGDFAILAKSGISSVPASAITGDIGVSPAAATYITGFSLTSDASDTFATSTQVTGSVYAPDYQNPTPTQLTTAVGDMELAFTDASGRAPDVTELGSGNIGGMTLTTGVYKWGTGLLVPTDVTLNGSATDVWVFQIAQDLTLESGVRVELTGGALPENVFWQVAGHVELGTTAHLEGIVLCQTSVTLGTGASAIGRLLSQTAISLEQSIVVEPAQ